MAVEVLDPLNDWRPPMLSTMGVFSAEKLWNLGQCRFGVAPDWLGTVFQADVCGESNWITVAGDVAQLMVELIETAHYWMKQDNGITHYVRGTGSTAWVTEKLVHETKGGQRHFLFWVPGFTWADALDIAYYKATTGVTTFGEALMTAMQMYPHEIETELVLLTLAGHKRLEVAQSR